MMRLIFPGICMMALLISSCSNNEVKTDHVETATEKQLRDLAIQYPDSLLLKENLVQYFRDNGDYVQAIAETEDALKRDSLNDRFLYIKATLHFENGDTMNAIKTFEKAVSISPVPEYVISLGSIYAQTKNPKALAMADELLQSPLPNAQKQSLFIKGLYYSYIGSYAKAIPYFDDCLKIDYRYVIAYREKAICLYYLTNYAAALEELKKAVAVQSTFDEAYFWMGRCYEKLGKTKEAIDNYQVALQIDTGYAEAKEALNKIK